MLYTLIPVVESGEQCFFVVRNVVNCVSAKFRFN